MSNRNTTDPIIRSSSQEFDDIPIDNNNNDSAVVPSSKEEEEEKPTNRMMRTTKNAWRRAVGCCKKSTPRTKIHLKEHQIVKRKKAFGIEYMNLLRSKDVTEEKLQQVVQSCMQDIDDLVKEISDLENKIEQVTEETKSKLTQKPKQPKPIYPNSGLYSGGDPSLEDNDDDDDEKKPPSGTKTPPPEGAFSITSEEEEEEDNESHPEQESWLPPPPSTPPPAVPSA